VLPIKQYIKTIAILLLFIGGVSCNVMASSGYHKAPISAKYLPLTQPTNSSLFIFQPIDENEEDETEFFQSGWTLSYSLFLGYTEIKSVSYPPRNIAYYKLDRWLANQNFRI